MTWANLSGADLRSAELYGADLRGARLEHANLHGAYYGAKTQWPTGFDPAAAGAVFEEVEELITRQTAAMTEEEKERFEETLEELKAMSDNRDIDAKQEHDYSKLEMSEKQETSGRLTVNLDGHAEVYHHRGGEPFSPAEMRKMRAKTDSVLAKIGAGESLEGVDFSEAFLLRDVDLTGANLTDTNLSGVDLSGANLERANLSNAALSKKANLRDADLRGANLRGAQLDTADLRGANLDNADLHGANLFEANLSHADLRGANLTGALLLFANLRGANLSGLDLKGADLLCADLRNANLSESNLSGVDVSGAHYNADTKWPEGFDPVAAGAGLVD